MRTKACIFDLDGVIVDTAKYHFMAWKKLTDMLNIPFTAEQNERLKGVSRMESLGILLEIGGLNPDEQTKLNYAAIKNKWYNEYISRMTPDELLPGSISFINELRSAGILTAIGSASKNTPLILGRLGIEGLFDAVADGNTVSRAKPDPEVFLKAAEMLGVVPKACVVFEDAVAGVRAALNAGMTCIGIGSPQVLTGAVYVIPGLDKMNLKKLIEIENISGYEHLL
ncbi:MAG: beta-phosphoglucomutase [Bacteroidales bacterium]